MLKVPAPMRAPAPQHPPSAPRHAASPKSRASAFSSGGGIMLILLGILFCSIFYQNLPPNFGLNDPNVVPAAVGAPDAPVPTLNESTSANVLYRVIKVSMILVSLIVIGSRWALTSAVSKSMNSGFLVFMVLIPLSAAWSLDSGATINRFVSLASIVLVCFAISLAGWDRKRFQQLTIPPVMYILILSLIVGMANPTRIIEIGDDLSQKNAWHGITLTKNQFGMMAAIGVIICVNAWLSREGRTLLALAGSVISFICLILSRSNTSLLSTMVAVVFMVAVMRVPIIKQRYSAHVATALVVMLLLYECAIQDLIPGAHTLLSPVMGMTGKDGSLSGRTIIWDLVKQNMRTAPFLGTGYGAYWLGPVPSSPSYIFVYTMYFYPSESHNGYLEIMNDMGYLGLISLLFFLGVYVKQALELMRFDRAQAALYLGLLFHQLVMNMSESEWFARDSVFTIFILGVTCMSRALYESRVSAGEAAPVAR